MSVSIAQAQNAEEFYKGKTLNILVGASAGGGYDRYARIVSRHLPKQISGEPTIVVRNMPGAGSLKSVLYTNEAAPKDGTYMTAYNSGIMIETIAAGAQAKTKFTDYAFIGNMTRAFRACFTRKESGASSWDAFVNHKKLVFGATGRPSASYNDAAAIKNLFDLPLQIITAYPGTTEVYLAIERGELDGACVSWESLPRENLQNNKIDIVAKLSSGTRPGIPQSVPFIRDVAKSEEHKKILDVILAPFELGRPYIMSKDVPADRVTFMRRKFDAMMKAPEFLAETSKQKLEVDAMTGEEAQQIVEKLYALPPEIVTKALNALK